MGGAAAAGFALEKMEAEEAQEGQADVTEPNLGLLALTQ